MTKAPAAAGLAPTEARRAAEMEAWWCELDFMAVSRAPLSHTRKATARQKAIFLVHPDPVRVTM